MKITPTAVFVPLAILGLFAGAAAANDAATGFRLDRGSESRQPEAPSHDASVADAVGEAIGNADDPGADAPIPYGSAGSINWTFGTGYANDLNDDQEFNIHVALSRFFADDFEVGAELGAWYFDQIGEDTGGVNLSFIFRYHFLHADDYDWSLYGDMRIGVLVGLDLVPDGGTGFNFTPGAGLGFTKRLNDDGMRLQVGGRWAHISNGRISGDGRNPSRDSVMGYIGVVVPF